MSLAVGGYRSLHRRILRMGAGKKGKRERADLIGGLQLTASSGQGQKIGLD